MNRNLPNWIIALAGVALAVAGWALQRQIAQASDIAVVQSETSNVKEDIKELKVDVKELLRRVPAQKP
jgi:hypothetical protein